MIKKRYTVDNTVKITIRSAYELKRHSLLQNQKKKKKKLAVKRLKYKDSCDPEERTGLAGSEVWEPMQVLAVVGRHLEERGVQLRRGTRAQRVHVERVD